ncbi:MULTISPECIES: metal-dependent hydrolase [unclassified Saccharopolyspora]|uniref:metal-dependent hydrolase n=1 Tax=Saccharopolyspora TaxID=1835 RepID=UPI00190B96AE|nr:metal-dependent hydrolase [Saccharopolyspora sp. HNM0986]MBK0869270.1 metal-dependent hydrolase [Saccharopolyspora sp. HNM0986]
MQAGGHACTGALAGAFSGNAVAALTGAQLGATATAVGALLGAGAALLPDLDADGTTAYRSGGPVTAAVGKSFQRLARAAYARTRLPHDPKGDGEHRGLVHTPVFAVATGLLVGLGALVTPWVTMATLIVVLAPGIAALSRSGPGWVRRRLRTHRDGMALLAAAVITLALLVGGEGDELGWYAGVSIAVGMIVHSAGDSATRSGIPWTWPMRRRCSQCSGPAECAGSRWRRGHVLPKNLRWRVGSRSGQRIEQVIEVICLVLVAALVLPDLSTLLTG